MINKSGKPLAWFIKKKRETTQITKNKKWKRSYNWHTEIQKIIRDYYKQLYSTKMDNQEEMNKFLEMYILPRLNEEEIQNRNTPITNKEIEPVILKRPTKSRTREFVRWIVPVREELTSILFKLLEKIAEKGTLPHSFYEASISLVPKLDKDITKRKEKKITGKYNIDVKMLNKILANQIQQYKDHIP